MFRDNGCELRKAFLEFEPRPGRSILDVFRVSLDRIRSAMPTASRLLHIGFPEQNLSWTRNFICPLEVPPEVLVAMLSRYAISRGHLSVYAQDERMEDYPASEAKLLCHYCVSGSVLPSVSM
jgi:hypothetical protein